MLIKQHIAKSKISHFKEGVVLWKSCFKTDVMEDLSIIANQRIHRFKE